MIYRYLLFFFLITVTNIQCMSISIKATGHTTISLAIMLVQDVPELEKVARILKKDFEFTGQFDACIKKIDTASVSKEQIKKMNSSHQLALFLNGCDDNHIEWRLYNTRTVSMIKGKKYTKKGTTEKEWAHAIADMVWPVMTNNPGFFATKVAFCKEVPLPSGHSYKHIYVADFDGSDPQLVIGSSTINVAPRWNRDAENPILFYSECTKSNIRLMALDIKSLRKKIVSNFDGLNMLPAFSQDGKRVVYCASRGDGACNLYYYEKGKFKRLTHNNGNNISPTFAECADKIYFCSDFETGLPQIYSYDFVQNSQERITQSGYCASPVFNAAKQQLAYTRLVNGVNQIFVYDIAKKEHQQITFDAANKEECSWSTCGNYLLCCIADKNASRIALIDICSQQTRYITPIGDRCSYPSWSPSICYG